MKPHIVLITTDQMRADLMGCAGNPIIQTPHLDILSRRGIRFEQAYSATPICIPARASIMTGLEGHCMGITTYVEGFKLPTETTLPQTLGDAGYETRLVGKMHVYPERCHYGFDSMLLCEEGRLFGAKTAEKRGYDDYELWLAEQGYPGQAFAHGIANNEYAMSPWHLPDHLHPTEWIADQSCKTIKRRDWTRPLFLWASFTAPHPPLTPLMRDLYLYERDEMPKPVSGDWVERHSIYDQRTIERYCGEILTDKQADLAYRGFYASITQVDRAINRIIGTLREAGILDNTWIIFTSDHGDNMGDHKLWFKANFTRGACQIPLIIVPPTKSPIRDESWVSGRTTRSPVGLQDIMPTCLAIAGIAEVDGLDGRSLLPLVAEPEEASVRHCLLGEFGHSGQRTLMVTDGQWKYIWYEEDGHELLFDLYTDSLEMHDLTNLNEEQLQQWRDELARMLSARESDPAVQNGQLISRGTKRLLNVKEKADLVQDFNPRGIH
ncbi:sulfatase-like hydrolase/transferase [Paenibacillus qinlingensis]|uniref:Arylsulfatase A-like enzyme n=1 Tax=Paenibacillus qinlingensis TaxID=1837343 RepID=A0ABU1NRG6_9BACL|nr:sulfatase-like hydrolase/transferase [Paenibacillus qinlingensis]MDR6550074.1 arylsulfatase A-like enzyme [Paenibacillus qinlingensis]